MADVMAWPKDVTPVSALGVESRATFISRTYFHLLGAVIAFVFLEILFFSTGFADTVAMTVLTRGGWMWLLFLGAFVLFGSLATNFAATAESTGKQYFGLFAYVFLEAIIFIPLLWIANRYADGAIESAAIITLVGFAGLTATVFATRKDFSWMRGMLGLIGTVAFMIIIGAVLFGFTLGLWFMIAMVALACGMILYTTSEVLHHYPEDRYVAAALALFASVALLFYYVLMIVISMQRD